MQRPSAEAREPLERVRALCMALPEVTERISHGEPAWFVKKGFANFADHHHDERIAFWCAAPPGAQEALIERAPERYFRPPYVGGRGWVGAYLDVPGVDWDEITDIIEDAYRTVAPPKLIQRLDAAGADTG
jgi:hypothetical protein